MTKLADASINSFGPMPEAGVPPEDPIFVLTSSQLQEIISRAIQPLKDEVAALREERDKDREEMAATKAKTASLEGSMSPSGNTAIDLTGWRAHTRDQGKRRLPGLRRSRSTF